MALVGAITALSFTGLWFLQGTQKSNPEAPAQLAKSKPNAAAVQQPRSLTELFPRTQEYDFPAPVPGTYELPALKDAAGGAVIDHQGRASTLGEEFDGKITLLSFIYTSCEDADGCPLATGLLFDLFHASENSPELAANAKLITLSFDPNHDTPAAMAEYGQSALEDEQHEQKMEWRFLTTSSPDQLKPILDGYGQAINLAKDSETINHLLRLYLDRPQGADPQRLWPRIPRSSSPIGRYRNAAHRGEARPGKLVRHVISPTHRFSLAVRRDSACRGPVIGSCRGRRLGEPRT